MRRHVVPLCDLPTSPVLHGPHNVSALGASSRKLPG